MFFSVVIPLYNKSYAIERCIKSILEQTYQKFEIVIVNDGSTDNSIDIIKQNYATEVSVGTIKILDQVNQGVSVARNEGVKASTAQYVCFLDADDEWLPNFLETMAKLIQDYPMANLYTLACYKQIENGELIKSKRGLPNNHRGYVNDFFKASAKGNVVHTLTSCVLKSKFEELGGFPEGVVAGEDLYLWILLALNGRVACEEAFLSIIHMQKDSSRAARRNSVPYPLVYFSNNKHLIKNSLDRYLFTIFYKHFASSLLNLNIKEAFLRFKYYFKTI